jgi:hypothetical protein
VERSVVTGVACSRRLPFICAGEVGFMCYKMSCHVSCDM